jgi:HAD superfamily hydrolase (TIGR01549 family)
MTVSRIKAVIYDFIGTLASVRDYNMESSKLKLHKAIVNAGFDVDSQTFLKAYNEAHEKYQAIRYKQLVEVTNAVWISEALNNLGFKTNSENTRIISAVNIFFEDYVNSLELNPCTKEMLQEISAKYKIGLISIFTYAPAIHASLKKLAINRFFKAVSVSEEIGWRKPHAKIFEETLKKLGVATEETVYVGDSPLEDIKGAQDLGMKAVFVPSQFCSLEDLSKSQQKPDMIVKDTCELCEKLPQFVSFF